MIPHNSWLQENALGGPRAHLDLAVQRPVALKQALIAACRAGSAAPVVQWAPAHIAKFEGACWKCPECDFCGVTKQSASLHRFKTHGRHRPLRDRVNTHHCCCCLQHFGTYERVICHITEKSARCEHYYKGWVPVLSDDELHAFRLATAENSQKYARSGVRRHHVDMPAIRCA